jgi:hypothetical protein
MPSIGWFSGTRKIFEDMTLSMLQRNISKGGDPMVEICCGKLFEIPHRRS